MSSSRLEPTASLAEIDDAVRGQLASGASLYRLDDDLLRSLRPDVIVTQDLCAVCAVDVTAVDDALAYLRCEAQVVTIDPPTLAAVLESIHTLGAAAGRREAAADLVASLAARLDSVRLATAAARRPTVLVLEWTDPPFGPGHWVPDLVEAAGGTPVLARPGRPSTRLDWHDVRAAATDVLVVAPCGFHLGAAVEIADALLASPGLPPSVAVWAIDADACVVRPGPRLVDGVEALASVLHPDAVPARPDLVRYVGTTSANTNPSRSTT